MTPQEEGFSETQCAFYSGRWECDCVSMLHYFRSVMEKNMDTGDQWNNPDWLRYRKTSDLQNHLGSNLDVPLN